MDGGDFLKSDPSECAFDNEQNECGLYNEQTGQFKLFIVQTWSSPDIHCAAQSGPQCLAKSTFCSALRHLHNSHGTI